MVAFQLVAAPLQEIGGGHSVFSEKPMHGAGPLVPRPSFIAHQDIPQAAAQQQGSAQASRSAADNHDIMPGTTCHRLVC
jgi:hypothetical protein